MKYKLHKSWYGWESVQGRNISLIYQYFTYYLMYYKVTYNFQSPLPQQEKAIIFPYTELPSLVGSLRAQSSNTVLEASSIFCSYRHDRLPFMLAIPVKTSRGISTYMDLTNEMFNSSIATEHGFWKSNWFQLIHQLILLRTESVALMGESVALMRLLKEDRSQLQRYWIYKRGDYILWSVK